MTQTQFREALNTRLERERRKHAKELVEVRGQLERAKRALVSQTVFLDAIRAVVREELANHLEGAE